MNSDALSIMNFGLTVLIAAATIWIAFAAYSISKRQFRLELERQKLDWCRACLHSMSRAVSLAMQTRSEFDERSFERRRHELRVEVISHRNEGELFLTPSNGSPGDVPCLQALKDCYNSLDEKKLGPPPEQMSIDEKKARRNDILNALGEFRTAMKNVFGNVWSEHD